MSGPINISVDDRIAELNRTFHQYFLLRKKGMSEMISHQAKNFRVNLVKEMTATAPGAPAIEAQNLARLSSGGGMKVSERAKEIVARKFGVVSSVASGRSFMVGTGKRGFSKAQRAQIEGIEKTAAVRGGTIQALNVAQEIRLRKSHNKFLASSAVFRGDMQVTTYSQTKGGHKLGVMKPAAADAESTAEFRWGGSVGKFSLMASDGMQKPKGQAALHAALSKTIADMQVYINRKLQQSEKHGINN